MKKLELYVAMLLALSTPVVAGTLMNPGKWQITVETEVLNAPIKIPSMAISKCVTEKEAANPEAPKGDADGGCRMSNYKIDVNVITWLLKCDNESTDGSGRITFHGDTYQGVIKLKTDGMEITQTLTGTRIGKCDN